LEYHHGGDEGQGVVFPSSAGQPIRVEYLTLGGERVSHPGKGLYLMRTTTADGRTVTRKVAVP